MQYDTDYNRNRHMDVHDDLSHVYRACPLCFQELSSFVVVELCKTGLAETVVNVCMSSCGRQSVDSVEPGALSHRTSPMMFGLYLEGP